MTEEVDREGNTRHFQYDKNGNLIKIIQPDEEESYTFHYDNMGRLESVRNALGFLEEQNAYDANGNLIRKKDALGTLVEYSYDIANRQKNIWTGEALRAKHQTESLESNQRSASTGKPSQTYTYDARGNIKGITDREGNQTRYDLDAWGRITTIHKPDGSKALSYTYTASGKVAGITDKSGKKTTYRYDKAGRVASVSDNGQLVAEYGYYEDGTLRQVKFANGVETSYTYNADKNYQSITTKTAEGEILLDYSYAYDGNGNRTKKVGSDAVSKYAGNDSASGVTNYIYDSLQRLQEVSYPNGKVEQFQYDNAGNRALKKYGTAENFKTGNYLEERYQYDNRNRLLERKNSQNVTYYQYDKQGNTVSELTKRFLKPETTKVQQADGRTLVSNSLAKTELEQYRTYEYNAFHQTSKVTVEDYHENSKETHVQENFYDAENLRYGVEEDGERTNFVTNGWSVYTELDAEWKPTKRLVRGYGIVASEEIGTATTTDVGSGYSNGYHYYHQNEHGDIEYITEKDGKIENAYTYDAFGNITSSTELVKNRYTYNGEQYDQVTQQYYLRARYYNPLVGRFTQEDVYRGDGLNLYAYCGNNPVMYVDPSGYAEVPITSKIEEVNDILKKNNNALGIEEGIVPGNSNGFDEWYNHLSVDDVATLYNDNQVAGKIKQRLRADGGVHEWFMVAEAPKTKSWGISAQDIKSATSNIESIRFVDIETKRFGVQSGAHGNSHGTVEASVSTTAHLQIQKMIRESSSSEEFSNKLKNWADSHLEITTADGKIIKGSKGLPEFFNKENKKTKKCS